MYKWKTKEQLTRLLYELVRIPSISGTQAEKDFPQTVVKELRELAYFKVNPAHLQQHFLEDGRSFVTALVKNKPETKRTVVLISHFDVVNVEDYGKWKNEAFDAEQLTALFYSMKDELPPEVRQDLEEGNWLFGRGTMDMKCGLALHMSMVEQAAFGAFDGNLLLLTVPDEEVNSEGMRAAVPALVELAQQDNLEYTAILNSEPMFTNFPGDKNHYMYTGSIGKALPGFFCYGKETHVGEPFAGLNSNYMAAKLTAEIELNTDFCERAGEEITPPPTNLMYRDLKTEYSTQIPHRSVVLFNLFMFERSMADSLALLREKAVQVAQEIEEVHRKQATSYARYRNFTPDQMRVRVMDYAELYRYALDKYGMEKITALQATISAQEAQPDDRERTIAFVNELAVLCNELAPMIVIFFAPPYYPAVHSGNDPLISEVVRDIQHYARTNYKMELHIQNYFGGISDLSYVSSNDDEHSVQSLIHNMPIWENGYSLPTQHMQQLNVPVLNIGPIGRDPHQWTERLDADFAFERLGHLLNRAVQRLLQRQNEVQEEAKQPVENKR